MKKFMLGMTVLLVIALTIGIGAFKFGLLPVNADVPPSGLEMRFIPIAVRASVARHAEEGSLEIAGALEVQCLASQR